MSTGTVSPTPLPSNTLSDCLRDYHATQVYQVRPWVYGTIVSAVIFGATTILYGQLVRRVSKVKLLTRHSRMLYICATTIFVLCTITFASGLKKAVDMVMLADCSSGNWAPWNRPAGRGLGVLGNICFMLSSWTAGALLIWRCLVLHHDMGKSKWAYLAVPKLLWIGSIVFGSIFCNYISNSPWDAFRPMRPYEFITLALNVLLASLIIARIFIQQSRTHTGSSVTAMLTESQCITLVTHVAMIASIFAVGDNGVTLVMYQVLAQVQALAPMLHIHHIMSQEQTFTPAMNEIIDTKSFGSVDKEVVV